jgi:hypothetical protein
MNVVVAVAVVVDEGNMFCASVDVDDDDVIDYDGDDDEMMKLPWILPTTSTTNERRRDDGGGRRRRRRCFKFTKSCPRARDCTSTQHDNDTDGLASR